MAKMEPGDVVSVEVGFFDSIMAIVLEPAHINTEKIRILTADGRLDEASGAQMIRVGVNVLKSFDPAATRAT